MYAALIAIATFPIAVLAHILLTRIKPQRAVTFLFSSEALHLLFLGIFFRESLLNGDKLSFFSSIFTSVATFLFYTELFSWLCRGFSLSILIDIYEKKNQSRRDLILNYASGKGADWLLEKRVDGMLRGGLLRKIDEEVAVGNGCGTFAAICGNTFKSLLKMGRGG